MIHNQPMDQQHLREVHRDDDGELCGYVRTTSTGFQALTVFHGVLDTFADENDAIESVCAHALASLKERWNFRESSTHEWQTVLIQEARPGWARLTLGYYAIAGVPTLDVAFRDDAAAEITLRIP